MKLKLGFKIIKVLGAGGTGIALKALDILTNRHVVLKVYLIPNAVHNGANEFKMIHSALNAPALSELSA
jgi:serine/threonine protein kinase